MTTHKALETFFDPYPSHKLKKGEIILQPDVPIAHIFYLTDGYVRMYRLLESGKELTITIFKPGSFFPLFLVLDAEVNTYYFESFTDCTLKQVPVDEVLDFVKRSRDVLFDFTRRVSRGMQGILDNLQYQLFGTVAQRTVATVVMLAARFGKQKGTGVQIYVPISHQDIANFVGVARETISLEMSELQKQGMIRASYKHIFIPSIAALSDLLKRG